MSDSKLTHSDQIHFDLDALDFSVAQRLKGLEKSGFVKRLWLKDASLWPGDVVSRGEIHDRLGWLTVAEEMEGKVEELQAFAEEVRSEGIEHAVVLGMGGSSLCPDVFRQTFRKHTSGLYLHVLDSTDPSQVSSVEEALDLSKTLFVVASKSGTTTEVQAFASYFSNKVDHPSKLIAITDEGSPLANFAQENGYRKVFLNPSDIGGRYSALSYFGLVPAALMGMDLKKLLTSAHRIRRSCEVEIPLSENCGVPFGVVMAEAVRAGRDKLTLLMPSELESFGSWIEQLVAESTGKLGKGVIPVDREPLDNLNHYGTDRLFVFVRYTHSQDNYLERAVKKLAKNGHPIVTITLDDLYDIGGEMFRWEVATATAGALMEINAFDQPNVQESKDLTKKVLSQYEASGHFDDEKALYEDSDFTLYADKALAEDVSFLSFDEVLKTHFQRLQRHDYLALLAYLPTTKAYDARFNRIRSLFIQNKNCATTVGYGPRYLHSTGQLHKGGPNSGVFLQLTHETGNDLAIPKKEYSFGVLLKAQALGDFRALVKHGRRVVRVHIHGDLLHGLNRIEQTLKRIVA